MSFFSESFHKLWFLPEIKRNCRVSVVIPIRDEADNIESTLDLLANQKGFDGQAHPRDSFEILVLANNCRDASAAVVKSWQKNNPSAVVHLAEVRLPPDKANIGYVRSRLMTEAYRRLCRNTHGGGVIMTTDGDTCPAENWIAANLREIEAGADAVGGRIFIKPEDLRQLSTKARRFHLLDTGYRLAAAEVEARLDAVSHDPAPRHHQHFNGSFAVTTESFRRAGGVPAVRFLEDVAFYQALRRVDARIRHSPCVRVKTSSRIAGRTELGLSTQISEWTLMGENGDSYFVESAAAIVEKACSQKILREVRRASSKICLETINRLAERLLVAPDFLAESLLERQTFGILLEKIYAAQCENGAWAQKYPLVCVTRALADLRQILIPLRQQSRPPAELKCS